MFLFRKSCLCGCFKTRHVTVWGMFLLATIRYVIFCNLGQPNTDWAGWSGCKNAHPGFELPIQVLLTAAIIIIFVDDGIAWKSFYVEIWLAIMWFWSTLPTQLLPTQLQRPSVWIANAGAGIAIIIFFDDDGIAWKPFHVEMGVWDISKMTFWTTNI